MELVPCEQPTYSVRIVGNHMMAEKEQAQVANGTSSILRPDFVPFCEERAVRIYQRNLPHWRQEGCTYFVTFRLGDSIPSGVRRQWEHEQTLWLRARGIRYDGPRGNWRSELQRLSARERFQFEKYFNQKVQACLDRGLGNCWFKRNDCSQVLREETLREDGERHHVGDFVIMPNHVHLLTTPLLGHDLEMILKRIKGKSAIDCNKLIDRSGCLWQQESHDHIVRNLEQLLFYREYIADNPKRAGIEIVEAAYYRAEWVDRWLS